MRLNEILTEGEVEIIPRDKNKSTAGVLADQLIRAVQYQAKGNPKKTREMAHKLADRFHSDLLASIDDSLDYQNLKTFDGRA